jgi:hypothetical protein
MMPNPAIQHWKCENVMHCVRPTYAETVREVSKQVLKD